MILSNKLYDGLRIAQDIIPIVGTLATTLCATYGVGENTIAIVGGTFTAITAALVSFLRICKNKYEAEEQ